MDKEWYKTTEARWFMYGIAKASDELNKVAYEEFAPNCKFCGSKRVVKYGTLKNVQRWWCKDCQRKFVDNNALPGMRMAKDQIALAVSEYYNGSSINAIRRNLQQQFGVYPSESTVYLWITAFSKKAILEANKIKINVGDNWVADETVLKIGGKKYWLIDVIDTDTRFLLGTKLSYNRNKNDIKALMEEARDRTAKTPKQVYTDGWKGYIDGLELAYGADAKHVQVTPFGSKEDSSTLIERWHGTLKDRTKVMRGLKRKDTAQLILDGYRVHYNFFRPHESLGDKTPAQTAKANFMYANWMDVVCKPTIRVISVKDKSLTSQLRLRYPHSPKPRKPRIYKPRTEGVFTNKEGTILTHRSFKGARRIM